jgi:hypothetical protein
MTAKPQATVPTTWSRRVRTVVSLLIVGHLSAVILPPLAFQTNGPLGLSPSVRMLLEPVQPYSQFMYLDRGYAFFAPNPGPSHLIQVTLTDSSGNQREQTYPDLERHWPRLLYHRHFMLSEFLNQSFAQPGPPSSLVIEDPDQALLWRNMRERYEQLRRSMTEHLERAHPGMSASIRRVEHLIPGVIEYQRQPQPLTDAELYQVLLDEPPAKQAVDGSPAVPSAAEQVPSPEQVPVRAGEPIGGPIWERTPIPLLDRDREPSQSPATDQESGR